MDLVWEIVLGVVAIALGFSPVWLIVILIWNDERELQKLRDREK